MAQGKSKRDMDLEREICGVSVRAAAIEPATGPQARLTRRERERRAVGQLLHELCGASALRHDAHGAPVLDGWRLSVSHSGRLAAIAAVRGGAGPAIGIDAEEWRPALLRVRSRYMSDDDEAMIDGDAELLAAWTAKEAVYKAAGSPELGLSQIRFAPGLGRAYACGRAYALHRMAAGPTLITLAIEEP